MDPVFNQKLIQYTMDESCVICIVFNENGTILEANSFARTLSGNDLAGKHLKDFFVDFSSLTEEPFKNFPVEGKMLVNVSTFTKLPATYYFSFYRYGDLMMALGELNNEEIEMMRKGLLDLNHQLGSLSRELQKSNIQLQRLNEQKNEFLGIAAHDLRNPIGIIMGYSDFLLEELQESIDEDQVHMLKTIQSTSQFMLHLLNELLDLTAIESGKLKLNLEPVDILDLLTHNASLNAVIALKKNIHVSLEFHEKLPNLLVDQLKIEQVMNNLISNAIKFSLPGTLIRIFAFQSGDYVTIGVADQGQGIPQEDLDKLFRPFQKASVRATSGEKSTGLGLSIVRNIVLGHQGRIWVESHVGQGTTFYFSLPLNLNSSSSIPIKN